MRRCRQCGKPKPDTGWKICAACYEANVKYRAASDETARKIRQEFQESPPSAMQPPELRRPSETRGRKARPANLAPYLRETGDDE